MKKIFFAVSLALILALAGCGRSGGSEADASLTPDPARAETTADTAAGRDESAHGSADAGRASVDLTLNGDLFCGEFDRVPVSDLGSIADFEYVGTRERGGVETVHEWVSEFRYSSVPSFRVIIMHDDHDFIDAAAEASVSRY